jgi:hypothetical protein
MAYVAEVPGWVWCVAVAVAAHVASWVLALRSYRSAEHWRGVAKKARTDALVWEAVAAGRARNAFGKKTIVAPQYHAPRAAIRPSR